MIEVNFCDRSIKKFVSTPETTVGELVQKIQQKMYLDKDIESFGLFEAKIVDGVKIEKYLKADDLVPKIESGGRFEFKKRFFYNDNKDDAVCTHLEFSQLREDVNRDRYTLNERELLELAAIDLRVTFGEPDASKHKAGFLVNAKHIERLIPRSFFDKKKPEAWEKLLLDEYQRIAFDPIESDFQGKLRYISRLKEMQQEFFGSVFFEATQSSTSISERVPSVIAVNRNGIHAFKKPPPPEKKGFFSKKSDDLPSQLALVKSSSFKEIQGWAILPQTNTFVYTITSSSASEGLRVEYESPVAADIPDVCQTFVQKIIAETESE
ncbi:MAG: hypothetical protein EZS28_008242 [Streblomastix strix]|uniref:FERM domain-containing protein n=1 Tax=Streblomastix strix TaxID=222440 RepID=A0A5J4WQ11_9EUKA|nr:MAG: hypothetical protein EZS28_008242 [Streblomastix strix]